MWGSQGSCRKSPIVSRYPALVVGHPANEFEIQFCTAQ